MESIPSRKTKDPFEGYLKIAFERLYVFLSLPNPATTCFRIFHGYQDHLPPALKGLTIDFYGHIILIQTGQQTILGEEITSYLLSHLPSSAPVILKQRYQENGLFLNKTTVLKGSAEGDPFFIKENSKIFRVQLQDKLDTGFYLDTAQVRKWIFQNASQKKILNLYSYTCSYGVAGMLGGALDVVHVDTSRSALEVGKNNYEANGIAVNHRSFNRLPVNDFLRFARKRKDVYDIIIVDPSPPQSSLKTSAEKCAYYCGPMSKCLTLLKPQGQILVSCHNFADLSPEQFKEAIEAQCRHLHFEESISYPEEFETSTPKMFVFRNNI